MPFHSFPFIFLFIPVVLAGYAAWGRLSADAARAWLIVASVFFYAWSEPRTLPILLISIVFNYWVSRGLGPDLDASSRRLKLGLAVNILALGIFKYLSFTSNNLSAIFGANWSIASILLPLGISFFTVQQIMFLVDRHQGVAEQPRFLDYTLFVSWFPYLVAGPITRWKDVIPQFPKERARLDGQNLARGTTLFVLGLAKKVMLASAFARVADKGFDQPAGLGTTGAWLTTVAFALQLYFDFSGYTDMARGSALMLNVNLPENFNNPFWALSISEFWQRWHMSLTNFITNYIYTPILRARRPTFRRAIFATLVTMTIAGIWHGVGWGFALFGLWHGICLVTNMAWRRYKREMPDAIAWCLTFGCVLVGLALFRAHTAGDACIVIRSMFFSGRISGPGFPAIIAEREPVRLLTLLAGICLLFYPATASNLAAQSELRPRLAAALAICLFLCLVAMNSAPATGFIYRQF